MNAKAASRVKAIASIRVFVFARIPPPEDEKKEALRSCSLRGFDFILVILVFVVFGDGDGGCRRGQRGEQRGEQKKKEENPTKIDLNPSYGRRYCCLRRAITWKPS